MIYADVRDGALTLELHGERAAFAVGGDVTELAVTLARCAGVDLQLSSSVRGAAEGFLRAALAMAETLVGGGAP